VVERAGFFEPLSLNARNIAYRTKSQVPKELSDCEMTRMVLARVAPRPFLRICFRIEGSTGATVLALPSLLAIVAVLGFVVLEVALAYS
jgi:hypothetical protein